jgi:acetyl-CoA acyltransferase
MKERIAVVTGLRTPFCKAGGAFKHWEAEDLGAFVVRELLARSDLDPNDVDELIFGNVLQPPHATNIARVLAVKGGLPIKVPAYTVNRNCASGLESISSAMNKILQDEAQIIIAGGTESMSNFPVLFSKKARDFFLRLSKAKSFQQKLGAAFSFRPSMLKPEIPGIADPICDLTMGQTAEILSREFHVTRFDQDEYALMSHQRAAKAQEDGRLAEEIIPLPSPPDFAFQEQDDGIRHDASIEGLTKLKPVFDKLTGTVTAGNSSQVTDGAAAVLLMRESRAKELGLKPLGYVSEYAVAALDPSRMGLGPVFAISKLLDKVDRKLSDIDLIEINEAFAAQVIACERALASSEFAKRALNRPSAVGVINRDHLNVNGGAVALGHPVGTSGTRLVLTLLKELRRRGKQVGVASLCIGGGQGQAALLEVE